MMQSIAGSIHLPSIQTQYFVRALFFLLIAIIFIAVVIHAFRKKRKEKHAGQSVEFSMLKDTFSQFQWGAIGLCSLFALVSLWFAIDQAVKFCRIAFS
jgi:cbb3-type cytochrome oxidase subunit 3